MKVTLIDKNVNGIDTIIRALSMCKDKQCTEQTLDAVLQAKPQPHLSALEFTWFCFEIDGVSEKIRLQNDRHRLASPMERSTRHIDMSDCIFIIPATAKNPKRFIERYEMQRQMYIDAIAEGESKEDAAYLLPTATGTKFVWAGNGRVLFDYFNKRLCRKYTQDEHYKMAFEMYKQVVAILPQFRYAIPCKECGQCREVEE